jgi:hypothetical protein
MIPLYKAIAILINIVVVITVFCGTWIGMWSLIDHIIDTKSISEMPTVGMLSESARIKMQEFRKKLNDSIQKESTPKHKPSSTICSPGSKKKRKEYIKCHF